MNFPVEVILGTNVMQDMTLPENHRNIGNLHIKRSVTGISANWDRTCYIFAVYMFSIHRVKFVRK